MNARSVVPSVLSVLLLAGCGGGAKTAAPPADATKLVPRDALVYVHLSTDRGRDATQQALEVAARFPSFARLRRSVLSRLSAPGCRISSKGGKEAALALLPGDGGTAGSLVLVDTGDAEPARQRNCGVVQVAKVGRFTVIGQPATIRQARALQAGKGRSLADLAAYRAGLDALPDDRVADAYVTQTGLRRLLAPQAGLLGITAALVDQPGLRSVAASIGSDDDHRARVVIRSTLGPGAKPSRPFRPTFQDVVPDSAFAYLGTRGLQGATAQLLTRVPGVDAARLRRVFSGEVGAALSFAVPAPVLTLVSRPSDPAAAARALRRIGLRTATVGGRLVAATKQSGLDALRRDHRPLASSPAWKAVHPDVPEKVSSLVFLDFKQLLRLAEQTGLGDDPSYQAVERDLSRVRTVGARSSGGGDETTVEILLSIL